MTCLSFLVYFKWCIDLGEGGRIGPGMLVRAYAADGRERAPVCNGVTGQHFQSCPVHVS